ncbi:hypothetical protein L917_09089 [Phytophthora nicotianae]|uniref:Uncharacterized protein n=1 Tax=Phytophthora nicotianae TaxID=4792 RepID=W2GUY6_PHYNI|nr:hypothetical protein L915_09255 [Phytophthora nicotianae]ETL92648.1 hypothetical protein L917_09089 [Phytophthora nicotianae]ETM45941.1 hypothetical protein L914_09117 [Phytophthora nicotianae]
MAHVWELSPVKVSSFCNFLHAISRLVDTHGNGREDADEDVGRSFADRALRDTTQLHHSRYIALDWIPSNL